MPETDDFARSLLEEAKRFLEKASENNSQPQSCAAHLHAALMLAFCSLEAHVNAIGDDFLERHDTSIHDRGILQELEVRIDAGEFKLTKTIKMMRLDDRIQFLHLRFSGEKLDTFQPWWGQLQEATKLRNKLTHPKEVVPITVEAVEKAIQAIIDTINALYLAIFKKSFPAAGRGLHSTLTF
jgi:hypothetical protein